MRRNIKRNLGLMIVLFMTFGLIACSKGGGISDGTDLLGKVLDQVSGENAHDDNADDGEGSNFWSSGSADEAEDKADVDNGADSDDWSSGSAGDADDEADAGQSVDEFLAHYGLKLSDVDPDEPYYRAMLEGSRITFFMEAGTEKNHGVYIHKVMNACQAMAADGKLYNADWGFFMQDGTSEELEVPDEEEINSYYFYIAQFGYRYDQRLPVVTIGAGIPEYDLERNDDYAYPVYTLEIID